MKIRCLLTLLFLSITTFLSAQIWTAEVPYKTISAFDGILRDFIKTNDDGFLVLLKTRDSTTSAFTKIQNTIIKYNSLGELEWNKSYDFGVNIPNPFTNNGGAFPSKVIQLNNDNYLIRGGTIRDTINSSYIFITNAIGDSLSFQASENYHNVQLVNDRIWGLRNEDQQSLLSELDEMGNLVGETPLENAASLNLLVTPDESVFNRTELFFRKYNLNGEIIAEQNTDFFPKFFTANELAGMTVFEEQLIKFDSDLNIIWELEYEELFPWAISNFIRPSYEGLIRTQSDDYIIFGSVSDISSGDYIGVYLYKYSKDGNFIWGGIYPFDILPYSYITGAVEVEDGIVTIGGNMYDEKIQLIKLYPNGLDIPTNTSEIDFTTTNFHTFPNPVNSQLTIEFPEVITGQIQLINARGKIMVIENISFSEIHKMNLQDYPAGLYIVKVKTEDGIISSQTIIKK